MNTRAGKGEYILQTHSTKFLEDSMGGGLNPTNPPSGYATASRSCSRDWCNFGAQKKTELVHTSTQLYVRHVRHVVVMRVVA